MPEDRLELVRRIYDEWAAGDFRAVDWAHPDIELVVADGPSPGSFTGLDEMARGWGEVLSAWEDLRAQAEEIRRLDEERVLVLSRNSGRGRTSGVELGAMETRGANVFHIYEGQVTKLVIYWNRDRAYADLGIEE